MKAAIFKGPGQVDFQEVAKPELAEGEILVRVRACGICGSDLHTYRHGMFLQLGLPVDEGRILGHEFSGEVVETRGTGPLCPSEDLRARRSGLLDEEHIGIRESRDGSRPTQTTRGRFSVGDPEEVDDGRSVEAASAQACQRLEAAPCLPSLT